MVSVVTVHLNSVMSSAVLMASAKHTCVHVCSMVLACTIFYADGGISNFFFLGDTMWCHYKDCHSDSGLILRTQGTSSTTISNTKLSLLYSISRQDQCTCFHCLFMCISQHSWQQMSADPETVKLFSNCHDTAFADGQG